MPLRWLLVVFAILSSTGCALLKLTVLTGPGCCVDEGELRVEPVGGREARAVIDVNFIVEEFVVEQPTAVPVAPPDATPIGPPVMMLPPTGPPLLLVPVPAPPPPPVIVVAPPKADVRVQCSVEHHVSLERVTTRFVEYSTLERVLLGSWAFVAGTLGTGLLTSAIVGSERNLEERILGGAGGVVFAADAVATAGLALFHPTETHDGTSERPGPWSPAGQQCPADLGLVIDGMHLPFGADGRLEPADALRATNAVATNRPVGVAVRDGTLAPVDVVVSDAPFALSARGVATVVLP
jgi:hypothetical protein